MTNEHKLEPVAYRFAAPIAGEGGGIVGRRDWQYSTTQKGLPWWDRDGLVTVDQAEAHCETLRQALHDLVRDLEMRSKWKEGSSHGVVDCGNGVYMKAKAALGEL